MAAPVLIPQLSLFENPRPPAPERLGKAGISEIYARQILTKANGSLVGFDYSLNPYVGCGFSCTYCFAAFFQAEEDRFESWGKWVEIKANAVELLRKKKDLYGKRIFMSSATDPYQPLEAKVELTRRLVEEMTEPTRQPRLVVQTRGPLVTRDIDLLKRLEHVRVNMSITTDDDEMRKRFEPGCAAIERRLEAIEELRSHGIATTVCVVPMLPLHDPEAFAKRIKKTGTTYVATGFFQSNDRPFAASTRDPALQIAAEVGWTREEYEKAKEALWKHIPELRNDRGFRPA